MFKAINRWLKDRNIQIGKDDIKTLIRNTQIVHIPKGTIMMPQGRPVQHLYFINNGIVRLLRHGKEQDTTIDFVPEHEFASTIIYILNQQPSPCALEALTDLQALYWSREDVLFLRQHVSCSEAIEKALLDRLLNWSQDREVAILNLSPEERYHKLFDEHPDVIRKIPLKYIASYLGIHQDSLSRIRNKMARKS